MPAVFFPESGDVIVTHSGRGRYLHSRPIVPRTQFLHARQNDFTSSVEEASVIRSDPFISDGLIRNGRIPAHT